MPQTLATPEARLAVLDSLVLRHRGIAWPLLRGLLPEMHGVGTYTHEPRFRTWKKEMGPLTMKEYWQVVDGVLEDMLAIVAESPDLWPDLIEHLPDLPGPKRAEIYERLVRLGDDEQT